MSRLKQKLLERAKEQITPSETEQGKAAAEVVAGMETEVASSVNKLLDAVDDDESIEVDFDARKQEILDILDVTADEGMLYRDIKQAGISIALDQAEQYAQLDGDDWEQQKQSWASEYRDKNEEAFSGKTVDEIANIHCRQVFDCSVDEFERVVIEPDRGDRLTRELVHPTLELAETIERIAEEIDE